MPRPIICQNFALLITFLKKAQIAYKLQDPACQTGELAAFRQELVEEMAAKVQALNRENFAVRQHLRNAKFPQKSKM